MTLHGLLVAVTVVLGTACGEADDDDASEPGTTEPFIDVDPVQCVPGEASQCYCGFRIGEQTCLASGSEKGPCRCDDDPSSGSSTTGSGDTETSGSTSG